jgi:bacteriorhodopsin
MLFFGYLGETNVIPLIWGIIIGFIPFIIYYYIIYDKFVKSDNETHTNTITDTNTNVNTDQSNINTTILKLFLYFLFFWSLYGIIGFLPYYIKNTIYNILDLFSKNFFGLLLSYLIISKSINPD